MKNNSPDKKDGNCPSKTWDKCLPEEESHQADMDIEMQELKTYSNSEEDCYLRTTCRISDSQIKSHEHCEVGKRTYVKKPPIIIEGIPDLNNDGVIDIRDVLIAVKLEIEKGDKIQDK